MHEEEVHADGLVGAGTRPAGAGAGAGPPAAGPGAGVVEGVTTSTQLFPPPQVLPGTT